MFSVYKDKGYKLFKKTTLYVVRKDANGNMQDSAPCKDCHETILELNIKKIVYSGPNNSVIICKPTEYINNHECQGKKHLKNIKLKN
jgi:deoxycytidylate deaminase